MCELDEFVPRVWRHVRLGGVAIGAEDLHVAEPGLGAVVEYAVHYRPTVVVVSLGVPAIEGEMLRGVTCGALPSQADQ